MFVKVIPIRGSLSPITQIYVWKSLKDELERKRRREADLLRELASNVKDQDRLESEISALDPS